MRLDARIPVQIVEHGGEPDAAGKPVLVRVGATDAETGSGWLAVRSVRDDAIALHAPACGCGACGGRSPVASALGVLFTQRAKGEVALFDLLVLSVPPGKASEIAGALRDDVLVSGRFRL